MYLHPSSVQELECDCYWNKAIKVLTPGNNGIPKWIRQREKGSQIVLELLPNWHKNNDDLGFSIFSVCIPLGRGWFNCKLNFCGERSGWDVDNICFSCCQIYVEPNEMCVIYYPKVGIEKHYWSNKWRRLKASFHGLDGLPVEVKECGFHLIYSHNIPEYASSASAQTSYHHTQFTDHSDPPTDTTTQNVSNNVVDAPDEEDEEDIYNWLGLLCKFVRWIYYIFWRRH